MLCYFLGYSISGHQFQPQRAINHSLAAFLPFSPPLLHHNSNWLKIYLNLSHVICVCVGACKAREGALFPVAGVISCCGLNYMVLGIKLSFSASVTTAPHLSATAQDMHDQSHIFFCIFYQERSIFCALGLLKCLFFIFFNHSVAIL